MIARYTVAKGMKGMIAVFSINDCLEGGSHEG